jgi:hypothetical protein
MIVMRGGPRGQSERFQVFRRNEIGERPVCPRFPLRLSPVSPLPSERIFRARPAYRRFSLASAGRSDY